MTAAPIDQTTRQRAASARRAASQTPGSQDRTATPGSQTGHATVSDVDQTGHSAPGKSASGPQPGSDVSQIRRGAPGKSASGPQPVPADGQAGFDTLGEAAAGPQPVPAGGPSGKTVRQSGRPARRPRRQATRPAEPAAGRTDKQDAILAAALELFAERGFHGTAVPLVAERAGVGAGTIYRYFDSKEALVNALYRKWKGAMLETLVQDFPLDRPARQQFHTVWQRLLDFARRHPLALHFLELHHHGPYMDEASRALTQQLLGPFVLFLDETRRQLVTKDVPSELLIAIVWGAFVGLVKAAREGYLTLTPALVEQAETCCWEAIRR